MNLKDRVEFSSVTYDDESEEKTVYSVVRRVVPSTCPLLPELANEIFWFLQSTGFSYVTGVTIHKEAGSDVRSDV